MQTFVMGDIHGAFKALLQCLQRCGFNYSSDRLIQLGDVADGFEDVYDCVEELLKIKHLVAIKGNHDDWFMQFMLSGQHPKHWQQGGVATAASYLRLSGRMNDIKQGVTGWQTALTPADIPTAHQQFFMHQLPYFIDEHNNCFVHGGFNNTLPFAGQEAGTYCWNRQLWFDAVAAAAGGSALVTPFKQVFIGHTNTLRWQTDLPMQAGNIYNLDTGAGHHGRLTIMNVITRQYWQSDPVKTLYIH